MLDARAVRQLERLSLVDLEALVAGLVGQRAGPTGGRGLEFADYRPYTPGDELRRIDWNIYARLGELFVKTAPSEAHVDMALLIDGSRSMDEGQPSKFRHAQRLAAMLGTVALLGSDVVQIHMLADGTSRSGPSLTAPQQVAPLTAEIASLPRGQRTDLAGSIRDYRRGNLDADLAVLLSDGLQPIDELGQTLAQLAASARSTAFVHVLDETELSTPLHGPVELRDRETGERIVIDITPAVQRRYGERFDAFAQRLRELCHAHGVVYVRALTSVPPLDLLLQAARRAELVSL